MGGRTGKGREPVHHASVIPPAPESATGGNGHEPRAVARPAEIPPGPHPYRFDLFLGEIWDSVVRSVSERSMNAREWWERVWPKARIEALSDTRVRRIARIFFWTTILLTVGGFVMVLLTPRPLRIAPRWVQSLVAASVLTFWYVGRWLLSRSETVKDEGRRRIAWMFEFAALLGSVVYACATYSNLESTGHWPGGVVVGWTADLMFMPAIAFLLPPFLAIVPDGKIPDRPWGKAVGIPGSLAVLSLFTASLFERHLVARPDAIPPLGRTAWVHASAPLEIAGLVALAFAVGASLLRVRSRIAPLKSTDPITQQLKWYRFGGVVGLLALAPYLVTAAYHIPYVPRANQLARAWGAVVAAALPLAAIPATLGWPWREVRMRRLLRAAIIATIVTMLHELLVKHFADSLLAHPERQQSTGSGLFITYGVTLLVAVLIEPAASAVHYLIYHSFRRRRTLPTYWLGEAWVDVCATRANLDSARKRQERNGGGPTSRSDGSPSSRAALRSVKRLRSALELLEDIDTQSVEARRLAQRIKERLSPAPSGEDGG